MQLVTKRWGQSVAVKWQLPCNTALYPLEGSNASTGLNVTCQLLILSIGGTIIVFEATSVLAN